MLLFARLFGKVPSTDCSGFCENRGMDA